MTYLIKVLLVLLTSTAYIYADEVEGYWTMDFSGTHKRQSAIMVYKYNGLLYARMVAIFDKHTGKIIDTPKLAKEKAQGIKGLPPLCGLDFVWGLSKQTNQYTNGNIIDPDSGNIYSCEIWYDKEKKQLVLRGQLFIFGENKYLDKISPEKLPQACLYQNPIPKIPTPISNSIF